MDAAESVWDYPRPPRLEPTTSHLRIVHGGITVAETHRALRILETSHPPVFYLPPQDIRMDLLRPSDARQSFCEFKGLAVYWNLVLDDPFLQTIVPNVAWSYPQPSPTYAALRDHLAFYPGKVDECWVDGEQVQPQAGDFYGGWITSRVRGPFKGGPGTRGW